jgi:hypothetical protein
MVFVFLLIRVGVAVRGRMRRLCADCWLDIFTTLMLLGQRC